MSFNVPDDLYYTESHEWIKRMNGRVRLGITDFAQDKLGDIVFVELPANGDELEKGNAMGVIESIKAVSDIYAPVSGTVASLNGDLVDTPEFINVDPYGDGWLLEIELDEELRDLLDASEYTKQIT